MSFALQFLIVAYLRLLGSPQFQTDLKTIVPDRRTAGVLAYLALEGSVHKYRLAGWLWSESGEEAAKNNMRQLLRRLRLNVGDVILGDDQITLLPELETDVRQFSYLETPSLEALRQNDELLAGFDYDDAPDFEEWLISAREELHQLRVRSARSEAERLEASNNHKMALEYAQVWARLEPLSEEAQRLLMRLHYVQGDRGAALLVFEDLKTLLEQELGTTPLPETLALAQLLERGGQLPDAAPKPKNAVLPSAVLRPPVLAGREREWALIEEAWAQGKIIFLVGEAGSGKSRLATDFLTSKGKFIHLQTRPGDFSVPYSTNNRFARTMLAQYTDYQPPAWVRQTLAHWLPELGEPPGTPDQVVQNRYYQAMGDVFNQIGLHGEAAFIDDMQFMDDLSMRTGEFLLSQLFPLNQSKGLRGHVCCYRKGEISPLKEQVYNEMVAQEMAMRIFLEPLPLEAVTTMLQGLGLDNAEHLSLGLARYTGGNPLFITETIKHLIETDTLEQGLPSRLSPPGKVAALVGRRLQRLSEQALNLARVVAVASTAFDLKLAAFVLERSPIELAEAHAELETVQILKGNAFVHDLVFEATLAEIPVAIRQVLNARTATYLESNQANPALVAVHWEAAGDGDQAAQCLIRAAIIAEDLGLFEDMKKHLERAIDVAVSTELRLAAQVRLADVLGPLGQVKESIALAKRVLGESRDLETRQRALNVLQNGYRILGRYAEAEPFIDQGIALAEQTGNLEAVDGMRFAKALGMLRTGRFDAAIELLTEILPRYRLKPLSTDLLQVLTALGNTLCMAGRSAEALPLLREAKEMAEDASMGAPAIILATSSLLYGLTCTSGSETLLGEAERLLETGDYTIADHLRNNLVLAYWRLGQPQDAAPHCQNLIEKGRDPNYVCVAQARLALLEPDQAQAHLETAKELYPQTIMPAARFVVLQAAAQMGDVALKVWAKQEFTGLERSTVPWIFQDEYNQLQTALKTA